MRRWMKRLVLVLIAGGGAGAVYSVMAKRRNGAKVPSASQQWPPFNSGATRPDVIVAHAAAAPEADWVAPIDGRCPDGYPIKANDNSHIYHLPQGRSYQRTVAERCYATVEAAERDGYRRAKA